MVWLSKPSRDSTVAWTAESMAERGDVFTESTEKIKEEITCALCLDILEQPRILPCYHVYCKSCLETMESTSGGGGNGLLP